MIVLDASAVLAVVYNEPGTEKIAPRLPQGLMSVVNLAETLSKIAMNGGDPAFAAAQLRSAGIEFAPVTEVQTIDAAALRPLTAHLGLSLGDRLCLALARERRLPVLTTERRWLEYDFGVPVELGR
ncbi:MAG: type II toxin-antitoxin system VapC family toxin [Caulobacterales bacterium]|nr:type II toxin-antitoxin system VapC family toxin [Caulobacterales bacterium]